MHHPVILVVLVQDWENCIAVSFEYLFFLEKVENKMM